MLCAMKQLPLIEHEFTNLQRNSCNRLHCWWSCWVGEFLSDNEWMLFRLFVNEQMSIVYVYKTRTSRRSESLRYSVQLTSQYYM